MALFTRMFLLLCTAAGLVVLGRLFFLHTSPPFSAGWIAQIALGLSFTIVGGGTFYAVNKLLRRSEKGKTLLKAHPQQPWLGREDWSQGYAESDTSGLSLVFLVVGLTAILLFLPFIGKIISEFQHGHWQIVFMLLLPLIGVGFFIVFVREVMRFKRYGQSRFEYTPPISLGSHLKGKITMKGMVLLNQPATIEVSCRHVVQPPGAGTQSSTVSNKTYKVLWQGSCTSTGVPDYHGVALPVDIPLPYDLKESTDNTRISFVEWVLNVTSHVAGVDFHGVYSIPVYRTKKSNPALTLASLHAQESKSYQAAAPKQFKYFTVQQTAAGLQIITRRGLGWLNGVIGIGGSLFLFILFTYIGYKAVTVSGANITVVASLLVLFDSLPLVGLVASIIGIFKKTYLTFGPEAINVRKSGLINSTRQYPYREIIGVGIDTVGASENASLYYLVLNLNLSGVPKKKKILYSNHKGDIEWLLAQLESHLPHSRTRN